MVQISRRGFIYACSAGTASVLVQSCSRVPIRKSAPADTPWTPRITPFITPNEEFYLIAVDPDFRPAVTLDTVDSRWALDIVDGNGVVRSISYSDLNVLATRSVWYTFECIGNPPGGPLIGNARWRVVPMKRLLAELFPGSIDARTVMFEGLDGFYSSVTLEQAIDDYAFVALGMNGVPLPQEHGFPVRVILPDLYGKKQPRWLKRISLLHETETTSYWEERHWRAGSVTTTSRLDPVRPQVEQGIATELTGMAFAGARGIKRVEVSIDGQQTWLPCEMLTPQREHAWSLWRHEQAIARRGRYEIAVRAVDGNGEIQVARETGAFPSGATGLHKLIMDVI